MSKMLENFIEYGAELQYFATTPARAQKAFATSCKICCTRGYQLDCDRCGIASAHNSVILIKFNKRSVS